ncbi:MAG TPA: DUF1684 domain-containing protein [Vicinamibacterales bacterium]|nr:DUF1684 domain-containing protein [Vicinamibacterales bacterium]
MASAAPRHHRAVASVRVAGLTAVLAAGLIDASVGARLPAAHAAAFGLRPAGAATPRPSPPEAAYRASIEEWRRQREAALRADDGWLTLTGLFFLEEGINRVGTDPGADVVLPPGSAPANAGVIEYRDGRTIVRLAPGVEATIDGKPVREAELRPDTTPGYEVLSIGRLKLWVHASGTRRAIRVRDPESPLRRNFTGCRWFPIDERYRVTGRFRPFPSPRTVEVVNILGDVEQYTSPGVVELTLEGTPVRLQALSAARGRLWIVFSDRTSGRETFRAARFVYTDPPAADGTVVVDFNKAYNPPCAFNPHTTCPLPPRSNRLPVRIEAGELDYRP